MTTVPRQFAIFLAVLAVLYALGYAVGRIIETDGSGDPRHGGAGTRIEWPVEDRESAEPATRWPAAVSPAASTGRPAAAPAGAAMV